MDDLMGKAFGSFSNILSNVSALGGSNVNLASFWDNEKKSFIRKICSAPSKRVEEEIVKKFLAISEKQLSQSNISDSEIEHYVQLAAICKILGYETPIIYIHALKLAQKGNLQQKQTGYLACTTFLHPQHELVILLTNTIQKDLCSSSYAEVKLGLMAVCNLIGSETVHDVIYLVGERITHEKPSIRKMAVLALNHCLQVANSPSADQMALPKLENVLADSDLSVVCASISALYNIIKKSPTQYGYLISSFIQLQSQLLQRHLPMEMEYHGIPVPWLQIQILKIFALLGNNTELSNQIFPVLKATLKQAEVKQFAAYAIIYEMAETVSCLQYNEEMTHLALSSTRKLLKSGSGNLKYMGVKALVTLIKKIKPNLAVEQQECVMECLNHPDVTLKTKTLELLYYLANPSNVQAVCMQIMAFVTSTRDEYLRKDLIFKALEIANKYNEDHTWYIQFINSAIFEAGDKITSSQIFDIINTISSDDSGSLRRVAEKTYLEIHKNSQLSSSMMPIAVSVLKESQEHRHVLCEFLQYSDEEDSLLWLLCSLEESILKTKTVPLNLHEYLDKLKYKSYNIMQKRAEILNIIGMLQDLPPFISHDELDPTMSFLDDFVCEALAKGSPCYIPLSLQNETKFSEITSTIHLKEDGSSNGASLLLSSKDTSISKSMMYESLSVPEASFLSWSSATSNIDLNDLPPHKNVWTKDGRRQKSIEVKERGPENIAIPSIEKAEKQIVPVATLCEDLFAGLSITSCESKK